MRFHGYLSSVLIKNKSVDLQRDIIFTLTPAVTEQCSCHASISPFPFPLKRPRIEKSSSLQSFAPLLGTHFKLCSGLEGYLYVN